MAEVLARAEAAPDDFVLKPQREGGGNNLYGPELAARLREREGLAAFILMQRIRPPVNMCAALAPALSACTCSPASFSRACLLCRREAQCTCLSYCTAGSPCSLDR